MPCAKYDEITKKGVTYRLYFAWNEIVSFAIYAATCPSSLLDGKCVLSV